MFSTVRELLISVSTAPAKNQFSLLLILLNTMVLQNKSRVEMKMNRYRRAEDTLEGRIKRKLMYISNVTVLFVNYMMHFVGLSMP